MPKPDVRPGQVWADNDWRSKGRTLRVVSIDGDHAVCEVLTNAHSAQARVDSGSPWTADTRGKLRRIAIKRFRPNNTGYRLVSEATD